MNKQCQRMIVCVWFTLMVSVSLRLLFAETNTGEVAISQINQVSNQLSEFEHTKSPELLENVVVKMENASFVNDQTTSAGERAPRAKLWLDILTTFDHNLDPNFGTSTNYLVQMNMTPPRDGTVVWPSGVDPKVIKDPKVRAEYEAALKANEERAVNAHLQLGLQRLEPRASRDAQRFLQSVYTSSEADKQELRELLERSALTPVRRQALQGILK